MSDDTWSSFHDDLIRPVEQRAEEQHQRLAQRGPSARTAGIEWDGTSGEIRTGAVESAPSTWNDLIRQWGLDPDEVETVGPVRRASWEVLSGSRTVILNSYRAQIRLKRTSDLDTEKLLEDIRKHKPARITPDSGDSSFVVCTGDTQLGKEGTKETIDRFLASLSSGPARMRELKKTGRSFRNIVLPWLGDCLCAETEIVTKQYGVVPIGDVSGQFVDVKDANGGWVNVQIKSYGLKPVTEIVWKSRKASKTVRASNGHEWILKDGSRVRSEDLKPGMVVSKGYRRHGNFPGISQTGVQAGFIYGDGTATGNGSRAIFCGSKDQELLPWFPGVEISEKDGKDQRRTASRFPESWKSTPSFLEGTSYLYGWLAGYFAADGCVDSRGDAKLSSADRGSLEFVRSVCAILGIDTYPIREVSNNAVGRFINNKLYEISLSPRTLPSEFFLLSSHRERILAAKNTKESSAYWTVESVRDTERVEETFCTEVPTTNSFILADGLLTSNCIEHVTGSYASQAATTELTLTEQIRLNRRLAWKQIETYAPLTQELIVPVVPGNHDQAVRAGSNQMTHQSDSFANDMASYLYDLIQVNPEAYGHVKIVVPDRKSLVVTYNMSGTLVAMAHGHQFPSGTDGAKRWWADQAHGCQPAGDATVLLAGHKHHLSVQQHGAKTFIQIPALDSGSQWWVNKTGQDSPPGVVSLVVGESGWRDLAIL